MTKPTLNFGQDLPTELIHAWQAGRLCLHPTDTLPGLSFHPLLPASQAALRALKGREETKPFISLVSTQEVAQQFWQPLPPPWERVLERLWPGPLTVVWQAAPAAPTSLVSAAGALALRCPLWTQANQWMAEVLKALDLPFPTTSVNPTAAPAFSTWQEAVGFAAAAAADTHLYIPQVRPEPVFAPAAQASSVIQLYPDGGFKLLRAGALPLTAIQALLTNL